jgi:hypothetical protein
MRGNIGMHSEASLGQLGGRTPPMRRLSKKPPSSVFYPPVSKFCKGVVNVVVIEFSTAARTNVVTPRRIRHPVEKTNWARIIHDQSSIAQ